MQMRLATTLFIISFVLGNGAFAKKNSDWLALESGSECLIMTTEKKDGNLTYPSSLFLNFNKNTRTLGAAVQNFEWGLRPRQSNVQFKVDQHKPKKLNVHLAENLMAVKASQLLKNFETKFKKGRVAKLLNSKGQKVAAFSLMGFSKSFKEFSRCAKANLAPHKVVTKPKLKPVNTSNSRSNKFSLDATSKQTLKFFLKAAFLFAIANGDLSVGGFMNSNADFSSDNQIFGQKGVTYRNVGNTIRSSEGQSWRKVGNTIRSSSGVTWRQVGNTMRSSTGTTCRTVANTYRCR